MKYTAFVVIACLMMACRVENVAPQHPDHVLALEEKETIYHPLDQLIVEDAGDQWKIMSPYVGPPDYQGISYIIESDSLHTYSACPEVNEGVEILVGRVDKGLGKNKLAAGQYVHFSYYTGVGLFDKDTVKTVLLE